jgi:Mg/Co/Ni transporter MgtE
VSISLDSYRVKRPVTVKASATILEAVEVIRQHSVSGLCVVDDDNKLMGVLSELACLHSIVERIYANKQASAGRRPVMHDNELIGQLPAARFLAISSNLQFRKNRRYEKREGHLSMS